MNKRPTQKEVAEFAGVSKATVSYVINNKEGGNIRVSDETREKVWQAVEELGYSVNVSARSLRTKKTNLIAVMVPDLVNPVFPILCRAMQNTAIKRGYQLLIFDSNKSVELEKAFYRAMRGRQVDGMILVNFRVPPEEVERAVQSGIHVVTSTIDLGIPGVGFIYADDLMVGEMATTHLIDRGHKRIAHISWSLEFSPNQLRYDGYKRIMKQHDSFDENLVVEIHRDTSRVRQVMESQMALENPPTAIFAGHDHVGIEAIKVAKSMGLSVPNDLAVIGVDNVPEATVIEPSLSTIDIQPKLIGEKMVDSILENMSKDPGDHEPVELYLPPKLVIREST